MKTVNTDDKAIKDSFLFYLLLIPVIASSSVKTDITDDRASEASLLSTADSKFISEDCYYR